MYSLWSISTTYNAFFHSTTLVDLKQNIIKNVTKIMVGTLHINSNLNETLWLKDYLAI